MKATTWSKEKGKTTQTQETSMASPRPMRSGLLGTAPILRLLISLKIHWVLWTLMNRIKIMKCMVLKVGSKRYMKMNLGRMSKLRISLMSIRNKFRVPLRRSPKTNSFILQVRPSIKAWFKSLWLTRNCLLNLQSLELSPRKNLPLLTTHSNKNRKILGFSWIVIRWDKKLRNECKNTGSMM